VEGLDGVPGRKMVSMSARLINWRGVNPGEPFADGELGTDFTERGLCPLGVERENEGTKGIVGSGVRGGTGGESTSAGASRSVAELIHFSCCAPGRGGDSGNKRKLSAK